MFLFDSFKETKVDFHMNFTHSLMKKLITPMSPLTLFNFYNTEKTKISKSDEISFSLFSTSLLDQFSTSLMNTLNTHLYKITRIKTVSITLQFSYFIYTNQTYDTSTRYRLTLPHKISFSCSIQLKSYTA